MIELEKEQDFKSLIKEGLVLVDFNAVWCGPCRNFKPILTEFAKEHKEIKVISIDVDSYENLSREYGVMSIPNIKLFKDGNIIKETVGFMSKDELEEFVK